jgi:hypothetical protein
MTYSNWCEETKRLNCDDDCEFADKHCEHDDIDWGEFYGENDLVVIDGRCEECEMDFRETFMPNTRHYTLDGNELDTEDIQL